MLTKHDHTYNPVEDTGVITCPKCECRVLYSMSAATRPKYCPDCEKAEYDKFFNCEYFDLLTPERKRQRIEQDLRMPMPPVHKKSIQEMIQRV